MNKASVVVIAGLLLGTVGCAGRQQQQARGTTSSQQMSGRSERQNLNDAEVAAVLTAVNQGEVQSAQLAASKAQHPAVRDYATRMMEEHQQAAQRDQQLMRQLDIQPRQNEVARRLSNDTEQNVQQLRQAGAHEFDREYVRSQIDTHRRVLDLIDNVLMPSTEDPRLRAELMSMRPSIAGHLEHAQRLQAELQGSQPDMGGQRGATGYPMGPGADAEQAIENAPTTEIGTMPATLEPAADTMY